MEKRFLVVIKLICIWVFVGSVHAGNDNAEKQVKLVINSQLLKKLDDRDGLFDFLGRYINSAYIECDLEKLLTLVKLPLSKKEAESAKGALSVLLRISKEDPVDEICIDVEFYNPPLKEKNSQEFPISVNGRFIIEGKSGTKKFSDSIYFGKSNGEWVYAIRPPRGKARKVIKLQ